MTDLDNFVNAHVSGYLDKLSQTLIKKNRWKSFFVVLTNVGVLCFEDPSEDPKIFLPILDCQLFEVDPEEAFGDTTVFRLEHTRKSVTLRCATLTEYRKWTRAIQDL